MSDKNSPANRSDRPDGDADPVLPELKEMYDSVVEEPLPQHLLNLLDKLDEAEKSR